MLLPTNRVIVRDFAFQENDPRYSGQSQQQPLIHEGARRRRTKWRTVEGSEDGDYFEEVPDDEEDEEKIGFDETDLDAPDDIVEELKGDDPSPQGEDDDESFHGLFRALYDFQGENSQELSFGVGDWLWISYRHTAGWLVGQRMKSRKRRKSESDADDEIAIDELEIDTDETGLIPENYVEFVGSQDTDDIAAEKSASSRTSQGSVPPVPKSPASSTPTERLSTASKASSRRQSRVNGDIASLAGLKRQSNGDIVGLLQAES